MEFSFSTSYYAEDKNELTLSIMFLGAFILEYLNGRNLRYPNGTGGLYNKSTLKSVPFLVKPSIFPVEAFLWDLEG